MSIINPEQVLGSHHFPSAKASGFGQSSFDPYDLSSNDKEYLTTKCRVETTPGRRDCAAPPFTAPMLYLISPPKAQKT